MTGYSSLGYWEIGWDEEDLELIELPIQWIPDGSWPPDVKPTSSDEWTPGVAAPLKRVIRNHDGATAATVAIVTVNGEAPFEVLHPDAATRRKEIALDFGDASRSSARTWARRYLNVAAQAREGITIELIPNIGPVPYRDFGIGDNISVLGEQHRVAAIGMKLDASSIIQWSVDLDQPKMLLEERLQAIMRRFLPGGVAGRTILPAPVDPQLPTNQAGSEKTETWSANADPGVVVLRKNGTAITGATVTVGIGDTEHVVLVDDERRYDAKVDKHDFTIDGVSGFPELAIPDGRWIQEMQVTGSDNGVSITILYR